MGGYYSPLVERRKRGEEEREGEGRRPTQAAASEMGNG